MWVLTAAMLLAIPVVVQGAVIPPCTKENGSMWYADTGTTITEAGTFQTFILNSTDNITENCSVIVTIDLGQPIGFRVEQFLEKGVKPYIYVVDDGNGSEVHNVITLSLQPLDSSFLFSSEALVKSSQPHQFLLQLVKGVRRISKFTVKVLPLVTMSPDKPPIDAFSTPDAYIASHEEFAEPDMIISTDNINNSLTLSNLANIYSITIEVLQFNLEEDSNASITLEIHSNLETLQIWNDTTVSKQHVINTTHIQWLTFELVGRRTDDFRGFLLKYSADVADIQTPTTTATLSTNNMNVTTEAFSPSMLPNTTEPETSTRIPTTSSTTEPPDPPSAFFDDIINIAAVSAGAGGALLLLIVVVLVCLLCRGNK